MANTNVELTLEQLTALREYAARHGRTWKSKLNDEWTNGWSAYDETRYDIGCLQQVRNQFGPGWLVSFRLTSRGMIQ